MKIVCFGGKGQHGKDTSANYLKGFLDDKNYKTLIVHYADLLKFICMQWFGWDGIKDDYGRKLLQEIGTDIIRADDPDYWVDFVAKLLLKFKNRWDFILIPDCRFPNELERLRELQFDTVYVRVNRSNFVSPLSKESQEHISEVALDDYPADFYIENSGTKAELRNKIIPLISALTKGGEMTNGNNCT